MKIEVYGVIYKIENTVNGKVYIGQTTNGFKGRYGCRWWEKTTNKHLLFSISKYGVEVFKVCEVQDVAFSKEELDAKEVYWIDYYNSTNPQKGYNKKHGGANGKPSLETIKKMRVINRRIADGNRGVKRPKKVTDKQKTTKLQQFMHKYSGEYADYLQSLLDKGVRKKEIQQEENISAWLLNKIIDHYNLQYTPLPSMSGNCKEKHHSYGKPQTERFKNILRQNAIKEMETRFQGEIENIEKMLDNNVSISEISRRYNCCRKTMRKVIKHYGLKTNGLNVRKFKKGDKMK